MTAAPTGPPAARALRDAPPPQPAISRSYNTIPGRRAACVGWRALKVDEILKSGAPGPTLPLSRFVLVLLHPISHFTALPLSDSPLSPKSIDKHFFKHHPRTPSALPPRTSTLGLRASGVVVVLHAARAQVR